MNDHDIFVVLAQHGDGSLDVEVLNNLATAIAYADRLAHKLAEPVRRIENEPVMLDGGDLPVFPFYAVCGDDEGTAVWVTKRELYSEPDEVP